MSIIRGLCFLTFFDTSKTEDASQEKLKEAIRIKETVAVEEGDMWRIPYLSKLLGQRQELVYLGEEVEEVSNQINSLCIN